LINLSNVWLILSKQDVYSPSVQRGPCSQWALTMKVAGSGSLKWPGQGGNWSGIRPGWGRIGLGSYFNAACGPGSQIRMCAYGSFICKASPWLHNMWALIRRRDGDLVAGTYPIPSWMHNSGSLDYNLVSYRTSPAAAAAINIISIEKVGNLSAKHCSCCATTSRT